MKTIRRLLIAVAWSALVAHLVQASPIGSAFTYQGHLKNAGSPATGPHNMAFALWDGAAAGNQIGPTLTFDGQGGNPAPVNVANGLFTVELDFGAAAFSGDRRWLETRVEDVPLTPRQELTAAPHARFASAPWVTSGSNISYSGGNVGIGTASPAAKLHLAGNAQVDGLVNVRRNDPLAYISLFPQGGTGAKDYWVGTKRSGDNILPGYIPDGSFFIWNQSEGQSAFYATVNGKHVIGDGPPAEPSYGLTVHGGIHVNGVSQFGEVDIPILHAGIIYICELTCTSDARFKEHVEPIAGALDTIDRLRGVTFDWKREEFPERNFSELRQVGLIAQELQKVLPQLVGKDKEGYLGVDYARLTPVLVEALKELKCRQAAQVEEQQRTIAELRRENAEMRARLDRLEAMIDVTVQLTKSGGR